MGKQLMSFIHWLNHVFLRVFFAFFIVIYSITVTYAQKKDEEIEDEISEMIGDLDGLEESIKGEMKNKLKAELKNAIINTLGIGASPIAEVASLRKVIAESFTKQNKIAKAMLQIETENNKSYLNISRDLADYYKSLKLPEKLKALKSDAIKSRNEINSLQYLTAEMKKNFVKYANKIEDIVKITNNIKLATNQYDDEVWMAEGQRIEILDKSNKDISEKQKQLLGISFYFKNINKRRESNAKQESKLIQFAGIK